MKRKFKLRIISILMVLIIMVPSFNVVMAKKADYYDLVNFYPFNSWAVEVGKKYDLIFLENNTRESKRYEIATLLYHLLNLKPENGNSKFNDVSNLDSSVIQKINSVARENIISGYKDGNFYPNNNVTRAEFVTMLDRAQILSESNVNNVNSFSDTRNHWAKNSIEKVASLGIISGKGDNKFCPDDGITPQEILVIMDRMVEGNYISSNDLISAITNTFKAKQYGKEEEYIVEVMYSEHDKVDTFMKASFPYKKYYNYTELNKLATHEDIQYVTYFMMSKLNRLEDSGESREVFNNVGKTILENKMSNGESYTIRDLLYTLLDLETVANTYPFGMWQVDDIPEIKYSNFREMTNDDKYVLENIIGNKLGTILVNNSMYLPLDAPINKYILNYFALNIQNTYCSYVLSFNSGLNAMTGDSIINETNAENLPSNYYEYPYILENVSKELYERPYIHDGKINIIKPIECFSKYSHISGEIGFKAEYYYDTILNVDYRTIDEEEFTTNVENALYYVPSQEIKQYIEYVKENEIIIEGQGTAIPGTLYFCDGKPYMKSMLKFKVKSAKKMENLLFGDQRSDLGAPVKYTKNEYFIYHELPALGGLYIMDDKVVTDIYKLSYEPIVYGVNWEHDEYYVME